MLDPGDADIELIPRVSPPPIPKTGSKRVRARSPSVPIREVKKKNAARVVVTDRRAAPMLVQIVSPARTTNATVAFRGADRNVEVTISTQVELGKREIGAIVLWCRKRCGAAALLRTITLVIRD